MIKYYIVMENNKPLDVPETKKPEDIKPAAPVPQGTLDTPVGEIIKPVIPLLSFEEFKKMDIRVGKVLSVENHPKADKLYVVKVDVGTEVRQVIAGLRPYMGPERLLNKSVIVICNLQPAVIRGLESQGMILAANTETPAGREVVILMPEKDMPPGSKVS